MDILYLSHCVPYPPDKGERIRAFHCVRELSRHCNVHVAALARSEAEWTGAAALREWCASVHLERFKPWPSLAGAAIRSVFTGRSLTMSYYRSAALVRYVESLCGRVRPQAAVAFSTPMAQYVPADVPLFLDMADVDSEKWMQYARLRPGGALYALEGRRLRAAEMIHASRSLATYLATPAEAALLKSLANGRCHASVIENGVDLDYFNPSAVQPLPEVTGQRSLVFVGVLDYFPNSDGVVRFCRDVFPGLRRSGLTDSFYIVGRNPPRAVRALAHLPGVTVTGGVPDVRPLLAGAQAVVAPLRVARGIQNKVLEGLAMGKPVLVSAEVARTFGAHLPPGVFVCPDAAAYASFLQSGLRTPAGVREAVAQRFVWRDQMSRLAQDLTGPAGPEEQRQREMLRANAAGVG